MKNMIAGAVVALGLFASVGATAEARGIERPVEHATAEHRTGSIHSHRIVMPSGYTCIQVVNAAGQEVLWTCGWPG
jgi:hypothetical protein